ncbi:unnamed protein product [Didymodactylos carnosus]|uniref:Uncharacterized protein n=1 Tax=Didymodactylos carnosus TaxID=1234261 RepID=A0A814KV57_9BILA|nr:unnamed protein product [Didymodactylos carnosus]CAF3825077.1 unnamed protein product [Didymodactylos carnosus]
MDYCPNLRTLSLNDNEIEIVPAQVGNWVYLKNLHLRNNRIALQQLNLSNNRLTAIPKQILKLNSLQFIDLSLNRITVIPDEIEWLQADELNLNNNQIVQISDRISRCKRLKTLRLNNNNLQLNTMPVSLLRDSVTLSLLSCLEGNRFSETQFQQYDGYEEYEKRYTAQRREMD